MSLFPHLRRNSIFIQFKLSESGRYTLINRYWVRLIVSRYRESAGFRFSNNLECSLVASVEERKLTEFSNNIIKLLRTNFPYLRFWLNCESIINSWQAGFCTTLNAICGFVFSKLYIFLVVFQCIYGGHTIFFSNRKFDVPLFVAVMPIISAPAVHDSKQQRTLSEIEYSYYVE